MTNDILITDEVGDMPMTRVALSEAQLEQNYKRMQLTQPERYRDWLHRHEQMAGNRTYQLPRIRELYSRALVTKTERDALHATRRVIESLVSKTFEGSQGEVGEWVQVLAAGNIDPSIEWAEPSSITNASLKECLRLMREASYDISEGVRFIRTPLVLPRLEYKYYVLDLERF